MQGTGFSVPAMCWIVSPSQVQFVSVSATIFVLLGLLAYAWCGAEFIQETYLYHLRRKDPRHSFAMHFYSIYLFEAAPQTTALLRRCGTCVPSISLTPTIFCP